MSTKDKTPKILKTTKDLVIVHKPYGWKVYADEEKEKSISLQDFVKEKLARSVFPVHRLDQDTHGIILFALSKESAAVWIKKFQTRDIEKTYEAFVFGSMVGSGTIRDPLKHPKKKTMERAETQYRCLKVYETEFGPVTHLECKPKTGRFHQIRKHLSLKGHPILGETKYGKKDIQKEFSELFLFSKSISYMDEKTRKKTTHTTKPDDFFSCLF